MASFCSNCGTQLAENAKFCVSCGQAAAQPLTAAQPAATVPQPQSAEHLAPATVVHQEQPEQQQQYIKQQPQYQQPYTASVAPKKKKGKLKIILPIVGAALVGIALLVIFVVLPSMMNTMAERDFYNIATNDVPTVKYILGEKRTVTGVSATTRADGYQEQVVTYKAEDGVNAQQDMVTYATAICNEHGFYAINDNNFSGVTGKGFQFAKESAINGNLVVVQIDYDMGGYTITLLHGKGTLKIPEGNGGADGQAFGEESTDGPWVGLWRFEDGASVELFALNADGTAEAYVFYKNETDDDLIISGNYTMQDNLVVITDLYHNGERTDGDMTFDFIVSGNTAKIDENTYSRISKKDMAAVLADPLAPYPTGRKNNGGTTAVTPSETCSFTGTWQLSDTWGKMFLTQNGDKVTGTYEIKGGVIEGTVSGNILVGTWYQTSNKSTGTIQLTMSEDGKSFGLKWEYETDPSKVDWPKDLESERGVLISSDSPANSLTANVFAMFDSGTYHMLMKVTYEETSQDIEIFSKDAQTAMLMETESMAVRIVVKDGKSYTVMDEYKTIIVNAANDEPEVPGVDKTSALTFVRQGAEDFHGKKYSYDEYTDGSGGRYLYYMDVGSLKGIRTVRGGETSDVEILAFDAKVPDSVFDIPSDYDVQDMSQP